MGPTPETGSGSGEGPLSAQTGSKRPQAGLPLSAESGHLLRRDEGGLVVLAIQGIAHDLASHADSIGLRSESILNPGRNVSRDHYGPKRVDSGHCIAFPSPCFPKGCPKVSIR